MNFNQAQTLYEHGRKYKVVGVKVGTNLWLRKLEDGNFSVQITVSKYFINDEGKQEKAGAAQRDKYTMEPVLFITPEYCQYFHAGNTRGSAYLESQFNIHVRKLPSVKQQGYQYRKRRPGAQYYDRSDEAYSDEVISGGGLRVYNDGRMEATEEPAQRVWDKTKQKQLNAHIKAARRMLGLRAKLGTFSSMDWVTTDVVLRKEYGYYIQPGAFLKMLMSIDDGNYNSLVPLIWLALRQKYGHYHFERATSNENLLEDFNNLIESRREEIRQLTGAVSYVTNNDAQQKEAQSGAEQETSDCDEADGQNELHRVPVPVP